MLISKIFTFDSAHKLLFYEGKCSQLHGHTFKLIIGVDGKVNEKTGMIVDFLEIKKIINENIIEKLDHKYLNDIIENPTCENIILWIQKELKDLKGLKKITLYETEKSFCEIEI